MGIRRGACRLRPHMPTLLTACTQETGNVTCRPCWGATRAEKRGNRPLGKLPMRNGSRHAAAQQDEVANSCIYNKQSPQSMRRNLLPMKLINGALLMGHEHLPCALVELMQIRKTPARP